jgi:type I restriction enzyme S subunit
MSKWPTAKLGDVLQHRKEFITINDLKNYKRPRVQLHVQGIVLRDEVPGALIKTKKQQVCRAGEFLVAEIDAKVGGFGIVPEALEGALVSSHYFLFVINDAKLDGRFLNFFIRTPAFREQVAAQGSTNYAAIRPSHVLSYEILLPPLAEQRRVVARIEKLAAQIHEARNLRLQAAEEAEELISSSRSKLISDSKGEEAVFDLLVEQLRGTSGLPLKEYKQNGKYPVIDQGQQFIGGFCDEKTRLLKINDPVVVWGDHTTNVKLVDFDFVPGADGTKVFRPRECISAAFLYQLLKSVKYPDLGYSRHYRILKKLSVKVPPAAEQKRIVAELNALQAEVDTLKRLQAETSAELDTLLPAILDRAFKGEL